MELEINPNITFKQFVIQAGAIKRTFEGTLRSFSYFELKDKVQYRINLRDSIYSLSFEEWKKDRIWDYLNGYMPYEELISIARK